MTEKDRKLVRTAFLSVPLSALGVESIQPHDATTQAQKNFCLESCPNAGRAELCDRCNGDGSIRRGRGRPRRNTGGESCRK